MFLAVKAPIAAGKRLGHTKSVKDQVKSTSGVVVRQLLLTGQLFGKNELANHAAAGAYGFLLSSTPAFILTALVMYLTLRSSPEKAVELISALNLFGGTMDTKAVVSGYLSAKGLGWPALVAALNLLWTGRVFALSLQRGLRVVFTKRGKQNQLVRDNLIPFGIELAALLYVLAYVLVQGSWGFIGRFLIPFAGLFGLSFWAYRFVPSVSPKTGASLQGALVCVLPFGIVATLFQVLVDPSRYSLLYGTLGSLMVLLANVYFFFSFFFLGAQWTFVADAFDSLMFSRFRNIQGTGSSKANPLEKRLFSNPRGPLKKYLKAYDDGEVLFSKDSGGNEIFYVVSGEVGIYLSYKAKEKTDDEPEPGQGAFTPQPVAVVKPGTFIGEMAYLLGEERTATAVAQGEAVLLVLPPALFESVLRDDPETARLVIGTLSARLKKTNETVTGG